MSSKRRGGHEEHENHERWLVSYADFITLLFATFVALYAMSSLDTKKFERMAAGMKSAFLEGAIGDVPIVVDFGSAEGGGSTGTSDAQWLNSGRSLQRMLAEEMAHTRQKIEEALAKRPDGEKVAKMVEIHATERGLVISLAEKLFFGSSQAEIQPEGRAALETLGATLRDTASPIRVEGHTDDRPIASARFPSNWELSTARAVAVARLLVEDSGIEPERMAAAGYAEFRPIAPNDTEENRARNRRVDIVLLAGAERAREPRPARSHESLIDLLDRAAGEAREAQRRNDASPDGPPALAPTPGRATSPSP